MTDADFDTVRMESPAEHLAEIRLDRPDSLNTVNGQMLEDLDGALDLLEAARAWTRTTSSPA